MSEKPEEKDWRKDKRKTGGSIKTIKGKLYARIQYIDETTGKRREKLRSAENRTKARELINKMRLELEQGGQATLESDKLNFKQIAERYEKIYLVAAVFQNGEKIEGRKSVLPLKSALRSLISYFGRKPIRNIRLTDVKAYKTQRLNEDVVIERNIKKPNPVEARKKFIYEKVKEIRPRKISSVNRELELLRQIFNFAKTEKLISSNPVSEGKVISNSVEAERDRVLTTLEEIALLTACENEHRQHIKPIIITALDTAAPRGELLKLQWKDVDLTKGIITIQATNSKTEKTRSFGMTARVKNELNRLWEQSPKIENGLVFGIKTDFKNAWQSALIEAEINDLRFHDLRHTAVTRFVRAGVPTPKIMKITGHQQLKTFQRYVNLTNDSVIESASLLDNFNAWQQSKLQTANNSKMVN
jgi:integrase